MRFDAVTALAGAFIYLAATCVANAASDADVENIVAREVQAMLPPKGDGGVAVAIRSNGRTLFFNYGQANAVQKVPVGTDSIFNLASVSKLFAATLLAQAVDQGELRLDDPVADYVTELQEGGDIRRITLLQLATHTSGLPRVPQTYEPWHREKYTLPDFIRFLKSWKADNNQEPGQQDQYSNTGFIVLRLALERRFKIPFTVLMEQRLTQRLAMNATALPPSPALLSRAVQGYDSDGKPIGSPGEEQSTLDWPGSGQIFSSPRDMATFLAANLGELPDHRLLESAMALAQHGIFAINPDVAQALAWEIVSSAQPSIIEKNGGLRTTSTYIGMIAQKKLGVVILANRGKQPATRVGRQILLGLAGRLSMPRKTSNAE
jgi:beta-lactamase class C